MDRIDLNLEAHPSYYGLEVFKDPDHQFLSSKLQTTSSSSSSSIPCYLFSSLTHDQGRYYCYESQQVGLEQEGGSDQHSLTSWSEKNEDGNKDDRADHISAHWISSNTSLRSDKDQSNNAMKLPTETMMPILGDHNKQMTSLKSENHSNSSSNITVRVCSDCHTTKTPLWRSGPKGPKSLCNACGIRQRKARRAMAAAANGTVVATTIVKSLKSKGQHKEHKPRTKPYVNSKFKKKCKPLKASACSSSGGKAINKLCFEDFIRISLRKHSAFHRFFPQDEKEAAILLMALSSGLVHG